MAEEQFKMMVMCEIFRRDGEYKTLVNSVLRSPALNQQQVNCNLPWTANLSDLM